MAIVFFTGTWIVSIAFIVLGVFSLGELKDRRSIEYYSLSLGPFLLGLLMNLSLVIYLFSSLTGG